MIIFSAARAATMQALLDNARPACPVSISRFDDDGEVDGAGQWAAVVTSPAMDPERLADLHAHATANGLDPAKFGPDLPHHACELENPDISGLAPVAPVIVMDEARDLLAPTSGKSQYLAVVTVFPDGREKEQCAEKQSPESAITRARMLTETLALPHKIYRGKKTPVCVAEYALAVPRVEPEPVAVVLAAASATPAQYLADDKLEAAKTRQLRRLQRLEAERVLATPRKLHGPVGRLFDVPTSGQGSLF